ncbi:hypothetical protein MHYP_G00235290 [Metynnis hypsauchen]
MPPKLHKTPGPTQSLIRPVATSTSDTACPADVCSAPAVSLDMSALRSEIVRAVVSEMRTVMDEHYSNIKTELLNMKSELLRDFAVLRSDFAGLKSTVSDIERSLSTCTDDVVALQAKVESLSKEISRLDAKCDYLESRSRRQNIRNVGIPEGESFTLTTSSVSELLKEAFALDKPPLVDRAHRTLAPKPKSGDPPRPVIARLHYYENCVEILRKARRQQRITVSNMKLSVFPDFTAKVARARAAFNEVNKKSPSKESNPEDLLRHVFAEEKSSEVRDLMKHYMNRYRMYVMQENHLLEETNWLEEQLASHLIWLKNSMLKDGHTIVLSSSGPMEVHSMHRCSSILLE